MAAALSVEAAEAKRVHVDALVDARLERPEMQDVPAGLLRDRLMQAYHGRLAPEFLLEFDDPASA